MKVLLKNIIWKEDNFYGAKCLNVEVSSFGESRDEALKNLQEALNLYFENMLSRRSPYNRTGRNCFN